MGKNIIIGEGTGELVEKKSRFIATAKEVHSEEEALKFIEEIKKKYWDARHNCFAFVIGKNAELQRFSDDREPSGTAGKPILEVINGAELVNICIVVTRYFGGILLGTGGLVRAYSGASANVIENLKNGECDGKIMKLCDGVKLSFDCEYKDIGRFDSLIAKCGCSVLKKDYLEKAVYEVAIESQNLPQFEKEAINMTSGNFEAAGRENITFGTNENETVMYAI